MQILSVTDNEFRKYGRIVDNIDFTALVEELKRTPIPAGVVYEPAVKELEALPVRLDISAVAYGEMPVQIGYCNGHNSKLNALEYHRDSEINVAATDMILMLGLLTSKHARVHNNIADSEDALLAATNKWLIGHEEGGLDDTAFIGLKGVNLDING